MRIRGTVAALIVSLLSNAGLALLLAYQVVDIAHYESDQASTWRYLSAERTQLRAMRSHFCRTNPHPTREALLSWERASRTPQHFTEPFDKDGMLGLRGLAVKLDGDSRAVGVCPFMTWQTLDDPDLRQLDHPADSCPLEPLC